MKKFVLGILRLTVKTAWKLVRRSRRKLEITREQESNKKASKLAGAIIQDRK